MDRALVVALRARPATTSSARCCASAPSATRSSVVDDQRGCPTYVGHLAAAVPAIVELPYGVYHVAAAGDCTWADFAEAIFEEAGVDCRVRRISTAEFGEGSAPGVLGAALRAGRAGAAALARRAARVPLAAARSVAFPPMRVLVTGGAGFIGSHFVRRLAARGDEVVVLDKLTYAGQPREPRRASRRVPSRATSPTARRSTRAAQGCDAIVNFAAETHVDRSILGATDFGRAEFFGTQVLLEHVREHGDALRAGLDRRGLRRPRARRLGEGDATAASRRARTASRRPRGDLHVPGVRRARSASTRRSRAARTPTARTSTRRS